MSPRSSGLANADGLAVAHNLSHNSTTQAFPTVQSIMRPTVSVEMPEDYLPEMPEQERNTYWHEEVSKNVTRMARACSRREDTGIKDFDRAWARLAMDRPEKPPEKCIYRRRLLRKFYHELTPILL